MDPQLGRFVRTFSSALVLVLGGCFALEAWFAPDMSVPPAPETGEGSLVPELDGGPPDARLVTEADLISAL